MTSSLQEFCVFGSGVWGTALAVQIDRKFGSCEIITKTHATLDSINQKHFNKGFYLSSTIRAEMDLARLNECQNIIIASPSYSMYQVIDDLKSVNIHPKINLIIATKGLDVKKQQFFSDTLEQNFMNKIAILSGPSFADEVIEGQVTALNIAAENMELANKLANLISTKTFVVVPSSDRIGLQISGIVKNILAIMTGILKGLNYGENIRSAVIAKGICEMLDIAKALGAPNSTNSLLAMMGDAILTASSSKSRNMNFGINLIQNPQSINNNLVEGKLAIDTLQKLAVKHGINLKLISLISTCLQYAESQKKDRIKSLIESSLPQVLSAF